MNFDIILISLLVTLFLSLQLVSARMASKALQPFVTVMLRFCMPPFLNRLMMQ